MIITHEGKVAFITGAGHGIGRATAVQLAADGAAIAAFDIRTEAAAETVAMIEAAGGRGLALTGDVTNRDHVTAAVQRTVSELGGLDLLVNNAGIVRMANLDELGDDEWDLVVDVNLKSQFIVSQVASRVMPHGGAIVNLGTVESEVVVSSSGHCQPHYNASKGGVKMLTKALAVELAAKGIRVNAIAPGPVNTGFSGADLTTPEAMAFMSTRLLVPRVAEPVDMARVISFLLSDMASYIDGVMLPVDGGWLTR